MHRDRTHSMNNNELLFIFDMYNIRIIYMHMRKRIEFARSGPCRVARANTSPMSDSLELLVSGIRTYSALNVHH